jgi:hypothetical protein
MNLKLEIDRYLTNLAEIGWDISRYEIEKINISQKIIESQLVDRGFSVINLVPLLEYFECISGVTTSTSQLTLDQQVLLPTWIPVQVNDAAEVYDFLPDYFSKTLFPVMHDYFGNYLCLDLSANEEKSGRVFECLQGFEPWPKYRDLAATFYLHSLAIEKGIVFIEDGHYLEMKPEEMSNLIDEYPRLATNPPD